MAGHVLRDLLQEIREAPFSLIVDEATDISNKEQLCINLRWVDCTLAIHEAPVEVIAVPRTDAATLTMIIKDALIHFALPLSQCRGQAYDGASNMAGRIWCSEAYTRGRRGRYLCALSSTLYQPMLTGYRETSCSNPRCFVFCPRHWPTNSFLAVKICTF